MDTIRYSCQVALPGFGQKGQRLLQQAKVLVVGAGGLGCPAAQYLAASGIGTLGIADDDTISISNLHRQILYTPADVGKLKATIAAERLQQQNPDITIIPHPVKVTAANVIELFKQYDIIVDGTDNFETRYLLNDAAVLSGKPLVYGAIYQYEGQVSVFNYQGGATYRCIFPEPPEAGQMLNCSEIGVLGVLPGIVGCYQANETVKIITGIGSVLKNQVLIIDTLNNSHQTFTFNPVPENLSIKTLAKNYHQTVCEVNTVQSISVEQLQQWIEQEEKFILVDVREEDEWDICHIAQSVHLPMGSVLQQPGLVPTGLPVAVLCHHGMRSMAVARQLVAAGYPAVYNVEGGIHAWAVKIDELMETY